MPVPWIVPPLHHLRQEPPVEVRKVEVEPGFVVTARQARFRLAEDRYEFADGVEARYGPTTLRADRLIVDRKNRTAQASGQVTLIDPDARISANDLDLDWSEEQRGMTLRRFDLAIAGVRVRAATAEVRPLEDPKPTTLIDMRDVSLTNCDQELPFYEIRTSRFTARTGERLRLEQPSLYIRGRKLLEVPTQSFRLTRRVRGLRLPFVAYDPDDGFGIAWGSGFLLGEKTAIDVSVRVFERLAPSYAAVLTRSFLPDSDEAGPVIPASDLDERFKFGYFDNIRVESPGAESDTLRRLRDSVSLGASLNVDGRPRQATTEISKPIDLTYERGGTLAGSGYYGQVRLQNIREQPQPGVTRLVVLGSLEGPKVVLGDGLDLVSRIDASGFLGGETYGWARAQAALVVRPVLPISVSFGLFGSVDAGRPDLTIDPLVARDGFFFRTDLDLGPTQISYLHKWRTGFSTYDREFQIRQVVGCFEPYYIYREAPSERGFGIRVRIDQFEDLLKRRSFTRQEPPVPPTTLFGPKPVRKQE